MLLGIQLQGSYKLRQVARKTMKPRTTLAQIAKRAGVHVTTVSMALRNHPSLPVSTRLRLQGLAAKMDYRVDPMLSALSQYRTNLREHASSVQVIYLNAYPDKDWRQEHCLVSLFEGAKRRAGELGYSFEQCWLHEEEMTSRRLSQIFQSRGINGIILGPSCRGRGHLRMSWEKHCWVKLGSHFHSPFINRISSNQVQCCQLAVRQALKLGYRRIGLAMRKSDHEASNRGWSAGYLAELANQPQEHRVPMLITENWSPSIFFKWYDRFKPEVILSFHIKTLEWLVNRKISVPKDVGFIDLDLRVTDGKVSGIFQHHLNIGMASVDVLTQLLQRNETGLPECSVTTLIEGSWCDGKTVRPVNVQN